MYKTTLWVTFKLFKLVGFDNYFSPEGGSIACLHTQMYSVLNTYIAVEASLQLVFLRNTSQREDELLHVYNRIRMPLTDIQVCRQLLKIFVYSRMRLVRWRLHSFRNPRPPLSMLVLNSRNWQGNVWLLEKPLNNKQHYKNQNTKNLPQC